MKDETRPFELPRNNGNDFEHIGKDVVLSSFNGGGNYSTGKLVDIKHGFYILNPHQGIECDKKEGWSEIIVKDNEYVPFYQTRVRPITEKSFESAIFLNNKERKKVLENKAKDITNQ